MTTFSPLQTIDNGYDANARLFTQKLSAGTNAYALTQTSYDAIGRVDCVAQRMNTLAFNSLPTSACTLGAQGPDGPDRITKTTYDAASRPASVITAYGVAGVQAVEAAATYTDNGKVETVTDGENNRTTYSYDGFDRPVKAVLPSIVKGANASDDNDFVGVTYDKNGNVTQAHLRDWRTIDFTYDNRNRMIFKDLPGTEADVTYDYDLLGRLTNASQPGSTLTFGYDALSRQTSETGPWASFTRQYDLAGNLTRTRWWDGFYVDYDRLVTGELSKIRENGAASGTGVLASYAYDNLGNRTGVTFGNGVSQTYAFDPVSRLTTLTNNVSGNGLTIGGAGRFQIRCLNLVSRDVFGFFCGGLGRCF